MPLKYFGGVPAIVVCDNCKQAVLTNRDWIDPDLNKDYAEWADHNHTVILPAKVRKPRYKSPWRMLSESWKRGSSTIWRITAISALNNSTAISEKAGCAKPRELQKKKDYSRYDKWEEERHELMPPVHAIPVHGAKNGESVWRLPCALRQRLL